MRSRVSQYQSYFQNVKLPSQFWSKSKRSTLKNNSTFSIHSRTSRTSHTKSIRTSRERRVQEARDKQRRQKISKVSMIVFFVVMLVIVFVGSTVELVKCGSGFRNGQKKKMIQRLKTSVRNHFYSPLLLKFSGISTVHLF